MTLSARRRTVGSWTVLDLAGPVDLSTVPALQRELRAAVADRPRVIVDLDEVEVLDGPVLGVLLDEARRARLAGGDLRVVATAPSLVERLALSRFDRAVDVHRTVSGAVAEPVVDDGSGPPEPAD